MKRVVPSSALLGRKQPKKDDEHVIDDENSSNSSTDESEKQRKLPARRCCWRRSPAASLGLLMLMLVVWWLGSYLDDNGVVTKKMSSGGVDLLSSTNRNYNATLFTTTTIDDSDDDDCFDKQPLVQLLRQSATTRQSANWTCRTLPRWSDVQDLYGSRPVRVGNCGTTPARHQVRVAGLYHTGTNALARLLQVNYGDSPQSNNSSSHRDWDVPWGKHQPAPLDVNDKNKTDNNYIFPIVLVRDPLRWMRKMCQVPYDAVWTRDKVRQHCPNLVSSREANPTVPVRVVTGGVNAIDSNNVNNQSVATYDSLLDLWVDWYARYYFAPYPRLFVRVEDLWFYPNQVWDALDACQVESSRHRQHQKQHRQVIYAPPSKSHGASADYLQALQRYGTWAGRHKGTSRADKEYINHILQTKHGVNWSALFQYPLVPIGGDSAKKQRSG